jgi:hypothetical protein
MLVAVVPMKAVEGDPAEFGAAVTPYVTPAKYRGLKLPAKPLKTMAHRRRFELLTPRFVV